MITTIKFDGTNYLTWSKSVLIHIEGRDKEEYQTKDAKKLLREDPKYGKWKTKNAMVKGWLLGFKKPEISDHYLFLDTAHQIWDSLAKAYSEVGHTTKVFDLRQKIALFKQGDQPIAIYYSALIKM